jgi:hypothetical protein
VDTDEPRRVPITVPRRVPIAVPRRVPIAVPRREDMNYLRRLSIDLSGDGIELRRPHIDLRSPPNSSRLLTNGYRVSPNLLRPNGIMMPVSLLRRPDLGAGSANDFRRPSIDYIRPFNEFWRPSVGIWRPSIGFRLPSHELRQPFESRQIVPHHFRRVPLDENANPNLPVIVSKCHLLICDDYNQEICISE